MPFGKHKGKQLSEIPVSYLKWVLENCDSLTPALRNAIDEAVSPSGAPVSIAIPSLAGRWYRQLACEFHPDRGGSDAAMKVVNRANDLLLQMAGVAR